MGDERTAFLCRLGGFAFFHTDRVSYRGALIKNNTRFFFNIYISPLFNFIIIRFSTLQQLGIFLIFLMVYTGRMIFYCRI